jgi:hypothetical protein
LFDDERACIAIHYELAPGVQMSHSDVCYAIIVRR